MPFWRQQGLNGFVLSLDDERTGWSPQIPSCAGTAASSPASGPARTGRDGRRLAPRSPP